VWQAVGVVNVWRSADAAVPVRLCALQCHVSRQLDARNRRPDGPDGLRLRRPPPVGGACWPALSGRASRALALLQGLAYV